MWFSLSVAEGTCTDPTLFNRKSWNHKHLWCPYLAGAVLIGSFFLRLVFFVEVSPWLRRNGKLYYIRFSKFTHLRGLRMAMLIWTKKINLQNETCNMARALSGLTFLHMYPYWQWQHWRSYCRGALYRTHLQPRYRCYLFTSDLSVVLTNAIRELDLKRSHQSIYIDWRFKKIQEGLLTLHSCHH